MKIVINKCYGCFSLSDECALAMGAKLTQGDIEGWLFHDWGEGNPIDDAGYRTDPKLIELMETKGSQWCSGYLSELKVVEIPDDVEWEISEYDGIEWVSEVHREWY